MNAGEWLRARSPRPPQALAQRLDDLLAERGLGASSNIQDALLLLSEQLLAELLRAGSSSRASAIDLLAADALVTYLMEAAAEDIGTLEACAELAMSHISAIAETASAGA